MKRYAIFLLGCFLPWLIACGSAAENQAMSAPAMMDMESGEAAMPADDGVMQSEEKLSTELLQSEGTTSRVIIYTGNLDMVVSDVPVAVEQITQLAEGQGGYVSAANIYQSGNDLLGSITVRVLAENYQATLAGLRLMAVRVTRENVATQDVTEEFVDLQARKTNLEVTEKALQELLDERKRMGSTSDILEVHRELTSIRGQIEQIEGRLRYLSNQASLSTITIGLYPDILAEPVSPASWQPSGVAKEALQTLVSILQMLTDSLIWVVICGLPLVVLLLIPLSLIGWAIRRWRNYRGTSA